MVKGRIALATALLALSAVFLVAAFQYIRLRAKIRGLQRRVVDSGWCLCLHCGYSLAGVGEEVGVCPECGGTYRLREIREAWREARFRSP
jgi:tRNA(Ile2) C34 agmatinyltransferase TiaS